MTKHMDWFGYEGEGEGGEGVDIWMRRTEQILRDFEFLSLVEYCVLS